MDTAEAMRPSPDVNPRQDHGAKASWEEDLLPKQSGNKSNLFTKIIILTFEFYRLKITLMFLFF